MIDCNGQQCGLRRAAGCLILLCASCVILGGSLDLSVF